MTDEERQKLCDDMREPWKLCDDVDADLAALMTRAVAEIERLQRELNSTLGLLYQESERRAKAEQLLRNSSHP